MISLFEFTGIRGRPRFGGLPTATKYFETPAFLLVPILFWVGVGVSRKSPRVYLVEVATRVHNLGVL